MLHRRSRGLSLVIVALLGTGSSTLAGPVSSEPHALQPGSRTAQAITGPIILSDTQIIFSSGATAGLTLVDPENEGPWELDGSIVTAQLFEITSEIGGLLNGNALCGEGSARFVTAHESGEPEYRKLTLTFFEGDAAPTGIEAPGLCGTYGYDLDRATWLDTGLPDEPPTSTGELAPSPEDAGKWLVRRDTNPVDDTQTVVASLRADSGQSRMGQPIEFYARCQSNMTEVFVVWHDYVGDDSSDVYDEYKYVTVRVGDAPPREERWSVSTSNDATFAPSWAGDLLKEMLTADRLVLRLTPYSESPITAVFDTSGLDMALRDLAATCNWSY